MARERPPAYTTTIDATPAAAPLARLQAEQGYKATNLRGENVSLDEIHRQTLRLLDGTRNTEMITEALIAAPKRGQMVLHREGDNETPVTEEPEARALLGPALEKILINLARKALLVRPDIKLESARRAAPAGQNGA